MIIFVQGYFNLGVLLGESMKRREDALRLYKESIRIQPNFPDAYHTMGTTYTALGRYAEVLYPTSAPASEVEVHFSSQQTL